MVSEQTSIQVSQTQLEFYHENGFLAVDSISDPDELVWMRAVYDRLFEQRAGREVGDQFDLGGIDDESGPAVLPQILGPDRYAPELKQGLFRRNAEAIARQLLGDGVKYQGSHAILKPAFTGAATPWHQDEAYWNPDEDHDAISIWIPLQPATLENGCMWFVPGSHRLEVLPHHCINNDPRIHGLEVDAADVSTAVACPLPAGGCTIHPVRTLHYTGPNHSPEPRRALILGFGLPAKPRKEPRVFYWNDQKQTPREERAKRRD